MVKHSVHQNPIYELYKETYSLFHWQKLTCYLSCVISVFFTQTVVPLMHISFKQSCYISPLLMNDFPDMVSHKLFVRVDVYKSYSSFQCIIVDR